MCIEQIKAMSSAQVAMCEQRIGDVHAALAMLFEHAFVPITVADSFCRKANFALPTIVGQRLAVVFVCRRRLRIKEVHLQQPAFEEDEDATLRLRREMRRTSRQRICRKARLLRQQPVLL